MVGIRGWVVMAFALGCVIWAVTPGLTSTEAHAADVASGELVVPSSWEPAGRVFQADGKTRAAKLSIKIRNVTQDKVSCEGRTDEKGYYKFPKLSPGEYEALYGDRVRVHLRVVDGDDPAMELLNVALPSDKDSEVKEIPRALSADKK